jgi:hypothetical protein
MNALAEALDKVKIKEPFALPWGEWKKWEQEQKKNRPIMYFCQLVVWQKIKDTCEDIRRKFWQDPIYAIKYRTTHKFNVLDTGLKPDYYNLDTRILHGLFNELVNFVECEKAWMNVVWGKEPGKRGLFERFRSPELGVQYLQWEIDLQGDENKANKVNAEIAKETLALYKWWKEVYLTRPDPMDKSGWSTYCDLRREQGHDILEHHNNRSEDEKQKAQMMIRNLHEIEEAYASEEEEMLLRLIKIRRHLWT